MALSVALNLTSQPSSCIRITCRASVAAVTVENFNHDQLPDFAWSDQVSTAGGTVAVSHRCFLK